MSALVGISIGLTLLLGCYALGHAAAAALFWFGRRSSGGPREAGPPDAVSVLIPARNEGDAALRVFESLLRQTHRGPVHAYLLVKDADDTSVPALEAAYPDFAQRDPAAEVVRVTQRGRVTAWVAFTGSDPKHSKVNWMVERVSTPWTAILDCDHQAHADWLRSATGRLHAEGARAVQGRRFPLAANGLFQLWDALHQHIGCEVFNVAWTRLGASVFLTGTTLVLDTALLRQHPLRSCITEDTDLSYRLFLQGTRIVADPTGGSDEEVSPDLYSFFARRRRWANGHTETFLEHLRLLPEAPISRLAKLQFLFHGAHYLMAVPVFALHLLLGGLFAARLQPTTALWALGLSLGLGLLGARTQRAAKKRRWLSEVAVLTAWYGPAVVIALNVAAAALLGDWARVALPGPSWVHTIGLLGLLTPPAVLLVGLAGFGQLGLSTLATVVLTYPVAFYLDLSGVLIGMMDLIFGRHLWLKVARAAPAEPEDAAMDPRLAPVVGIRDSWRPRAAIAWVGRALAMAVPRWKRPVTLVAWALVLGAVGGGAVYSHLSRVPIERAPCTALTHDTDPWIVTPDRLDGTGYCEEVPTHGPAFTRRMSAFQVARRDALSPPEPAFWDRQESTFFCNEAHFAPENVQPAEGGGVALVLKPEVKGDRQYTAADLVTKADADAQYRYGRFEVVMKPAKVSGTISAFFLYRFDPWQEIDTEFLGKDTTRIMLNVYYNPGDEGDLYNYGFAGTPVLVDLGFDAADDFHTYAVEWDADEIRWFVDDRLLHRRPAGRPTPIPHLPMRLHLNFWPTCSEALAGPLDVAKLPAAAEFRSVTISSRVPDPLARIWAWYDALWQPEPAARWQDRAAWIHDRGSVVPATP